MYIVLIPTEWLLANQATRNQRTRSFTYRQVCDNLPTATPANDLSMPEAAILYAQRGVNVPVFSNCT
eukprot:2538743-Pleurochrysis_carterae.AAC.4